LVQLAAVYVEIQAQGTELWAISPQTVVANEGLRRRRQLPFPILADADQHVIRAWGVFNDLDPKQRAIPYPATFIVGQNGRVQHQWLGLTTRERPTPAAVLAALAESD
jgi:thioredoxin-dependent peroxiredoxin